jgi:hypothetical protein
MSSALPEWLRSQLHARGICERCAGRPAVTVWAGSGLEICWECVEVLRSQGHG